MASSSFISRDYLKPIPIYRMDLHENGRYRRLLKKIDTILRRSTDSVYHVNALYYDRQFVAFVLEKLHPRVRFARPNGTSIVIGIFERGEKKGPSSTEVDPSGSFWKVVGEIEEYIDCQDPFYHESIGDDTRFQGLLLKTCHHINVKICSKSKPFSMGGYIGVDRDIVALVLRAIYSQVSINLCQEGRFWIDYRASVGSKSVRTYIDSVRTFIDEEKQQSIKRNCGTFFQTETLRGLDFILKEMHQAPLSPFQSRQIVVHYFSCQIKQTSSSSWESELVEEWVRQLLNSNLLTRVIGDRIREYRREEKAYIKYFMESPEMSQIRLRELKEFSRATLSLNDLLDFLKKIPSKEKEKHTLVVQLCGGKEVVAFLSHFPNKKALGDYISDAKRKVEIEERSHKYQEFAGEFLPLNKIECNLILRGLIPAEVPLMNVRVNGAVVIPIRNFEEPQKGFLRALILSMYKAGWDAEEMEAIAFERFQNDPMEQLLPEWVFVNTQLIKRAKSSRKNGSSEAEVLGLFREIYPNWKHVLIERAVERDLNYFFLLNRRELLPRSEFNIQFIARRMQRIKTLPILQLMSFEAWSRVDYVNGVIRTTYPNLYNGGLQLRKQEQQTATCDVYLDGAHYHVKQKKAFVLYPVLSEMTRVPDLDKPLATLTIEFSLWNGEVVHEGEIKIKDFFLTELGETQYKKEILTAFKLS